MLVPIFPFLLMKPKMLRDESRLSY
ncbi:hypothetical protein LINPERPRIM_LOCUS30070 [Linum perenne]